MRSFVVVATFVASALALKITSPKDNDVWTMDGNYQITWTSVDSDPDVFKMVLVNLNNTINQVLAPKVTTSKGVANFKYSYDYLPLDTVWKINFINVKNQADFLAESGLFYISGPADENAYYGTNITSEVILPVTMSNWTAATSTRPRYNVTSQVDIVVATMSNGTVATYTRPSYNESDIFVATMSNGTVATYTRPSNLNSVAPTYTSATRLNLTSDNTNINGASGLGKLSGTLVGAASLLYVFAF